MFHSPSGRPNLFYQAGDTVFDFSGPLKFSSIIAISHDYDGMFSSWEGAVDGLNWFKTISNTTGNTTWTEVLFDFTSHGTNDAGTIGRGFIGFTRYVTDRDGHDFTLDQALNIKNEVPEPSTLAIFALGMIGLASRRFKKQS